jgi:hypothetical protein
MHFTSVERVIAFVALVPGTFNYLRRRLFHPSQDSYRARVEEEISASRNCHEPSHAIVVESYKDLQSHLVSAALSADNFPALQSHGRGPACHLNASRRIHTPYIHTHHTYTKFRNYSFLYRQSGIGLAATLQSSSNGHRRRSPHRQHPEPTFKKKSVTLRSNPPRVFQQPNRTQPFHNASQTNHHRNTANTTPTARRSTPHREKRHPTNAVGSNAPTDQRARGE